MTDFHELCRCAWVKDESLYIEYHDEYHNREWGVPVYDDRFDNLLCFHAGLRAGA